MMVSRLVLLCTYSPAQRACEFDTGDDGAAQDEANYEHHQAMLRGYEAAAAGGGGGLTAAQAAAAASGNADWAAQGKDMVI